MVYTDQTKKAMKLCYKAHASQTDKSGLPYRFHHGKLGGWRQLEPDTGGRRVRDIISM